MLFKINWLRLESPIGKTVRLLFGFLALMAIATIFLATRTTNISSLEMPKIEDDLLAINPDTTPHSFIPAINVTVEVPADPSTNRANATLLMLARNSDIEGVEHSMRSLESKFNKNYNYSWVFLNEVPFTEEFKSRVTNLTRGNLQFGLVPPENWFQPDWINEAKKEKGMEELQNIKGTYPIPYATSTPYRNMCRFNSGFFFRHELLKPYKWYWRVEPGVDFTCDINIDPFTYMIQHNKRYSFTVTLTEVAPTIPSLWSTIKDFRATYPDLISEDNSISYITDKNGDYNLCHFWSNFEIADLDFFRSETYETYFDFLDSTGNFYYERWGDAPVHSIAVALFLPKDQVHFFNEIGYRHPPYEHCPPNPFYAQGSCDCDRGNSFDYTPASCLRRFEALFPYGRAG